MSDNKLTFRFVPIVGLVEIARVFKFGASKRDASDPSNARFSWRHSKKTAKQKQADAVDAILRHTLQLISADSDKAERDPESNLYHAAHIAAQALIWLDTALGPVGQELTKSSGSPVRTKAPAAPVRVEPETDDFDPLNCSLGRLG